MNPDKPDVGTPMSLLVIVIVVASQLLLNLLLLPRFQVVVPVQKVPGRQNSGTDQDQRELASHTGHDWAPQNLGASEKNWMLLSLPAFSCYRQQNPQKSTLRAFGRFAHNNLCLVNRRRVYLFVGTGVKAAAGF
jgi:hypothetical protein